MWNYLYPFTVQTITIPLTLMWTQISRRGETVLEFETKIKITSIRLLPIVPNLDIDNEIKFKNPKLHFFNILMAALLDTLMMTIADDGNGVFFFKKKKRS